MYASNKSNKGTYYFGSMLVISLATAGTVFTLNIYKSGDKEEPVPLIIQQIFFNIFARVLFINIKVNNNLKLSLADYFSKKQKIAHKKAAALVVNDDHANTKRSKSHSKEKSTKHHEWGSSTCQYVASKEFIHLKAQKGRRYAENYSDDTEMCRLASDMISNKILLKASPMITPLHLSNNTKNGHKIKSKAKTLYLIFFYLLLTKTLFEKHKSLFVFNNAPVLFSK